MNNNRKRFNTGFWAWFWGTIAILIMATLVLVAMAYINGDNIKKTDDISQIQTDRIKEQQKIAEEAEKKAEEAKLKAEEAEKKAIAAQIQADKLKEQKEIAEEAEKKAKAEQEKAEEAKLKAEEAEKKAIAAQKLVDEMKKHALENIAVVPEEVRNMPFSQTENAIDFEIDKAFAPVYANIKPYAEWHYSVWGEYTELGTAAIGNLSQSITEKLFIGFDNRLDTASKNVNQKFTTEFDKIIEKIIKEKSLEADQFPPDSRLFYNELLKKGINNTFDRFKYQATANLTGSIGAGMATKAALAVISKTIAKKVIATVAAKTAGKVALKATGVGGFAAAGAGAGSIAGPVGTAVGGFFGAVVGWFAVDGVIVNLDEYFNRDEFESELKQMIDEQKNKIKEQFKAESKKHVEILTGKSPSDL